MRHPLTMSTDAASVVDIPSRQGDSSLRELRCAVRLVTRGGWSRAQFRSVTCRCGLALGASDSVKSRGGR
jgi:hypothetical protein